MTDRFEKAADDLLRDAKPPRVAIGPVVRGRWIEDGNKPKYWYFVSASGNDTEFWTVQVRGAKDKSGMGRIRKRFIETLTRRKPIVIMAFESELHMAQWCKAGWPNKEAEEICDKVILEATQAKGHS